MSHLCFRSESIPELNETSTFSLKAVSSSAQIDQARSSAEVQVLANDDPFGVFSFSDEVVSVTVDESDAQTLSFAVVRGAGAIGLIDVTWAVTSCSQFNSATQTESDCSVSSSTDFQPIGGVITFRDGERRGTFTVTILEDDLPELTRTITISLTSAGRGRVSSRGFMISVTINENDDPFGIVRFASAAVERLTEGAILNVDLVRDRGLFGNLTATLRLLEDSTSLTDFNVQPTQVLFEEDQATASFAVSIIDDDEPEALETFRVLLDSTSIGEISGARDKRFIIEANDDFNGVLQFAVASRSFVIDEPESAITLTFDVERLRGAFGTVLVEYRVTGPSVESEFEARSGSLSFGPNVRLQSFNLTLNGDQIPEVPCVFPCELHLTRFRELRSLR